jgi:1-acyl-sn-glycerol-3-phosphate acyltransferase
VSAPDARAPVEPPAAAPEAEARRWPFETCGHVPREDPVVLPEDTLWDRAVAVALWAVGVAWMVPVMTLMMLAQLVRRPDRIEGLSRVYCRGQVAATGSRWRCVVDPSVDPDRAYIFAQNHVNLLDHVTMYPATPHFKQGIELASHFRIPIYGWFMKQRGTLGVVRGDPDKRAHLQQGMARELQAGHSLLVFPEGTRTTTGRVGRVRTGTLRMARDLGAPIAPVAVTGMYEVLRKGSWLLRPGHTVTVHVLAPIETAGLPDEALPALASEIRRRLAERVDAHWDAIEETP